MEARSQFHPAELISWFGLGVQLLVDDPPEPELLPPEPELLPPLPELLLPPEPELLLPPLPELLLPPLPELLLPPLPELLLPPLPEFPCVAGVAHPKATSEPRKKPTKDRRMGGTS
jgi:hypothetical protein